MKLKNVLTLILEQSQYEVTAKKILMSKEDMDESKADDLINQFKSNDFVKKKGDAITLMAILYNLNDNVNQVINTGKEFIDLLVDGKIKSFSVDKVEDKYRLTFVTSGGSTKQPNSFTDIANFVHGQQSDTGKKPKKSAEGIEPTKDKPIMSANGIDVFDARSVGKCIEYGEGSLTGIEYSFCIGKRGSQNMYSTFRINDGSTFYYIVDKNRMKKNEDGSLDLSDPLHIVVYDMLPDGRVQLTDQNNTTGNIAEFGTDYEAYQEYLEKNGIDYIKMVNRPRTEEEYWIAKTIKNKKGSMDFLLYLIDQGFKRDEERHEEDPKRGVLRYVSDYINQGHTLSDEQFDYIFDNAK